MRALWRTVEAWWTGESNATWAWLLAAASASLLPSSDAWRSPTSHRHEAAGTRRARSACEGARAELPETLVFHMQSGAFAGSGNPDVAVHVPRGFDATRRPGVLVYFHGWKGCVQAVMSDGDVPCHDGGDPRPGLGVAQQVDRARVNALAIAIELRPEMSTGEPGRLASPGGFRDLLRELLTDGLTPYLGCPIEVDGLDRVVLVAHSGGYQAAANVLALGDVPQIREVVLLDALYGAQDVFLRWMRDGVDEASTSVTGPRRRFVDVYTCCGGTAEASRAMARTTASWSDIEPPARAGPEDGRPFDATTILDESDRDLDGATLMHRWVFKRVARAHAALPREYMTIVAQSAGFERL